MAASSLAFRTSMLEGVGRGDQSCSKHQLLALGMVAFAASLLCASSKLSQAVQVQFGGFGTDAELHILVRVCVPDQQVLCVGSRLCA